MPESAPNRSLTPTEFLGMERKPNKNENIVRPIQTQATIPRTNGTGLMPRLGEAGPEERTTCMSDSEYGTDRSGAARFYRLHPSILNGWWPIGESASRFQSQRCV